MERKHVWNRRVVALAVGVVAVLVGGGAALATIPGSGGVISGCYAKSMGSLRVVDASAAQCKGGEAALTWNQTGPQGLKGDTGAQGPKGDQGVQGRRARGKTAVSGLYHQDNTEILDSEPTPDLKGWTVTVQGKYPAGAIMLSAMCANG